MKKGIEQAVLEMIKKSGVELGEENWRASSMPHSTRHQSTYRMRYPAFLSKKGRHIRRC